MSRLQFTFDGKPVNAPSNDNLYSGLSRYLTGKTGKNTTGRFQESNAQRLIQQRTDEAKQSGNSITGYRRINYKYNDPRGRFGGGGKSSYLDVPIFGQAQAPTQDPAQDGTAAGETTRAGFSPTELNTGQTPTVQQNQGPDYAAQFATQIKAMQDMFTQSIQSQQQQYQQMQAAQDKRMTALQQQMQQSMAAQQQRPEVAGVKMASGSAGTPMQIARRGISGAFGRSGMRISSLNVGP